MSQKKASIVFIFATIALDMIGVGLIVPTLPDIMKRFLTEPAAVANYFGYFISLYALMQFLAAPFLGALSDVYGRKPVLFVSLAVAALDYVLMAFAPNLLLLFAGRVVSGLTGANITVATAYIADVSTENNRAANFGLLGAAFGLGFIVGPAIGGVVGHYGAQYPFLLAACLCLVNLIYGIFVLPESLPLANRRKFDLAKINPFSGLRKIFSMQGLLPLLAVHFCFQMSGLTHPSIWTLYTKHKFNWTAAEVGISLAAVGLLSALSQGLLTRIIIPKMGEWKAVFIGSLGQIFVMSGYGIITVGWMMYVFLIPSAVFWIAGPALQSLLSARASADARGELQGTLVSLTSLASILNPILMTHIFSIFAQPNFHYYYPGAPYLVAGFFMLIAFLIMLQQTKNLKTQERPE